MFKPTIRLAVITAAILLIPVFGNLYVDGWNWSGGDFVFATVMIFGTGFLFELVRLKSGNSAYNFAAGLALAGAFLLIWINGAVGVIGDSDVNMLYAVVIFTLFVGTVIARLKPQGMSYALFATAFIQFLIPIIALTIGTPDFSPGVLRVFILNSFWVMLFVGSAVLFRASATDSKQTGT